MLRRNLLHLRRRRHHRPVHRHQAHRPRSSSSSPGSRDASTQLGSANTSPRCARCSCSPSLVGLAYPLVDDRRSPSSPACRTRPTGRWSPSDGKTVGSALIGQSFTDADGNAALAVLPVPAVRGRRRVRPDRHQRVATSARRASSTPCPTRPVKDDTGTPEPAHPGLRPQHGRRRAGGRRRRAGRTAPPTASARCSACSTATASPAR